MTHRVDASSEHDESRKTEKLLHPGVLRSRLNLCALTFFAPIYERASTKKQEGFYSALLCPQAITSCTLDPEQGGYVISVETPVPLDLVLLHSQVHMDLLESNDQDDLGQASLERVPLLVLT